MDGGVEELAKYLADNHVSERTLLRKLGHLYMKGINDAMDSFWEGLSNECKEKYEKYLNEKTGLLIKRIKKWAI